MMWGGKLLSRIKSMYVDSSACVRVNGGENERFRTDSGVRQGCIMFPWQFNVYMNGVKKDGKEGSELPEGWDRVEIAWPLVCR